MKHHGYVNSASDPPETHLSSSFILSQLFIGLRADIRWIWLDGRLPYRSPRTRLDVVSGLDAIRLVNPVGVALKRYYGKENKE